MHEGFEGALRKAIEQAHEEFVLFVVDDQVIVGRLDLEEAMTCMQRESVLCYSFRLGANIKDAEKIPFQTLGGSRIWGWRGQPKDWGYPFSLDATLYRRKDLEDRILSSDFRPKVPADFEVLGLGLMPTEDEIYMACPDGESRAICQDLNKVQTTHGAPAFGRMGEHDTQTLLDLWQQGHRLDWQSVQGFTHTDAFTRDLAWKLR